MYVLHRDQVICVSCNDKHGGFPWSINSPSKYSESHGIGEGMLHRSLLRLLRPLSNSNPRIINKGSTSNTLSVVAVLPHFNPLPAPPPAKIRGLTLKKVILSNQHRVQRPGPGQMSTRLRQSTKKDGERESIATCRHHNTTTRASGHENSTMGAAKESAAVSRRSWMSPTRKAGRRCKTNSVRSLRVPRIGKSNIRTCDDRVPHHLLSCMYVPSKYDTTHRKYVYFHVPREKHPAQNIGSTNVEVSPVSNPDAGSAPIPAAFLRIRLLVAMNNRIRRGKSENSTAHLCKTWLQTVCYGR